MKRAYIYDFIICMTVPLKCLKCLVNKISYRVYILSKSSFVIKVYLLTKQEWFYKCSVNGCRGNYDSEYKVNTA